MPAILNPLWMWDELEPMDELVTRSSGYIYDPDYGSALPQRVFVWCVERAREHVRDIHAWLSAALGFGPETVWAQQRAAYEREFAKFLRGGSGVLWGVAQPVRRPIRERLRAVNFDQKCSTPRPLVSPDAVKSITLGTHAEEIALKGFVFDGVGADAVVTTVAVRRTFPALVGQEAWCCLTAGGGDLALLKTGVVPRTRAYVPTTRAQALNKCAIFTLARNGSDRESLRFAAQLAPGTGATIDFRVARVSLQMSLRMDETEDCLLRRAYRLPPVPPDHEHSRLAELFEIDRHAVETAWDLTRRLDGRGVKEQVETLQLLEKLGSLNKVARCSRAFLQTVQARLEALGHLLGKDVYIPHSDRDAGGPVVTHEGKVLAEALRLLLASTGG